MESTECAMTVRTFKTSDGQVKIYIKPIQRSLSVIPVREELLSSISLKEKCIYCEKEFLLKDLRLHIDLCLSFPNLESDACPTESTLELPPTFDSSPSVNDINDKVNENSNNQSTHNEIPSKNTASALILPTKLLAEVKTCLKQGKLEKMTLMRRWWM